MFKRCKGTIATQAAQCIPTYLVCYRPVRRLNEREGTATALNQSKAYLPTLYAVALNVGRLNERNSTIVTQAAQIGGSR